MKKTKTTLDISSFSGDVREFLNGAEVYDSSCSNRAKTYFIDNKKGYYMKVAPKSSLKAEMEMAQYFASKGFTSKVCLYESAEQDILITEQDILITEQVIGEDCSEKQYLDNPKKLCDVFSKSLRKLHDTDSRGCPHSGVSSALIPLAHDKYKVGNIDPWMLEYVDIQRPQEAYAQLLELENCLVEDTHIHGDACLPNILLNDWEFSGFIDFDGGGIGDRHHDLFWAIWSLQFNLKTNEYKERFLDGYGRDKYNKDRYTLCGILQAFTY